MQFSIRQTVRLFAAVALLCAAPRLAAHGDLHDRIDALTTKLQADPDDAELWLQRADLNRQHEQFAAALTDLDKAGQLKPDWAAVPLLLARIRYDQADYSPAVRAATARLKLDPTNADALVIRARSHAKLKKLTLAVADYNALLANPGNANPLPDLYLERARAQAELKQYDDAIHGLDDGIKRLGFTPSLALPAIEYERQRGAFESALDRLERAKGFFSTKSYLLYRGEILLQAGRRAEARQDFETALAALDKMPSQQRAAAQNVELTSRLQAGLSQTNPPSSP